MDKHMVLGKEISELEDKAKNMALEKIELNLVDVFDAYRILYINDETLSLLKEEIKSYKKLGREHFDFGKDMKKYQNLARLATTKLSRILDHNDNERQYQFPRRDGIYSVPVDTKLPLSYFKKLMDKNLFDYFLENNTWVSKCIIYNDTNREKSVIRVKDLKETIDTFDFIAKFSKQMDEQEIKYVERYSNGYNYKKDNEVSNRISFRAVHDLDECITNLKKGIKFLSKIKDDELNDFINELKKICNYDLEIEYIFLRNERNFH